MKRYSLILSAMFLVFVYSSFGTINGQDRTREDKLREQEDKAKIEQEINQQKKEMIEHRRQEDIQRVIEDSREEVDRNEIEAALEDLRSRFREYHDEEGEQRNAGRHPNAPFAFSIPGFSFSGVFPGDNAERSSLSFSKSLKETSFNRDYIFDVAPTAKTVSMSITGYCKEGEIRIKIKMPDGKAYSDVIIDESGNLNWRKSFNISEEENMDKTGDWKYEIDASKATGYFRISLQTY